TLAGLALRDPDDAPMQTAVLSSALHHCDEMLHEVLAQRAAGPPPEKLLGQLLGLAASTHDEKAIAAPLAELCTPRSGDTFAAWQFGAFAAFLDALERSGLSFDQFAANARPAVERTL